jgi:hypothetical protein
MKVATEGMKVWNHLDLDFPSAFAGAFCDTEEDNTLERATARGSQSAQTRENICKKARAFSLKVFAEATPSDSRHPAVTNVLRRCA